MYIHTYIYIDIKVDRQLFHIIPYTYTVCILYNDVIYFCICTYNEYEYIENIFEAPSCFLSSAEVQPLRGRGLLGLPPNVSPRSSQPWRSGAVAGCWMEASTVEQ